MTHPVDPISPELALVSPELAARARAALPDRPWEAFVPPAPLVVAVEPRLSAPAAPPVAAAVRPPAHVAAEAAAKAVAIAPVVAAPALVPAAAHTAAPVVRPVATPTSRWPALPSARTALVVLVAAVGLYLLADRPVRNGPTLAAVPATARPQSQRPQAGAPAVKAPVKPGATQPTRPPTRATRPAQRSPKPTTPSAGRATTPKPSPSPTPRSKPQAPAADTSSVVQALPGGGYVFGGDGRLAIGQDGRTIAWLEGVTTCGQRVRVKAIPIGGDGRFSVRRTVKASGATIVARVTGRVASKSVIRGTLGVESRDCTGTARFTARLS